MTIEVSSGPNSAEVEGGDTTVGILRDRFSAAFNIPAGAQALVDGEPASDDTRVYNGSDVQFVKNTAEKGASL